MPRRTGNISCFTTKKDSKKYRTKKGTKVCFMWSRAARARASKRAKKTGFGTR